MNFTFSKEQELIATKQALHLLRSEKSSEKVAFAKNLVEEGWIEFEKETIYEYGYTYVGYWWLVHPSIAGEKWQDSDYDPEEDSVDTKLYYDLSYQLLSLG